MTLKQLFTLHFKDLPEKRQLNFQDPSSPIMEQIIILHDYTMFILTAILIFILWLLIKTSTNIIYWRNMNENTKLEIVWTTLPAIILTSIDVIGRVLYIVARVNMVWWYVMMICPALGK